MKDWYYSHQGQQRGPVTQEELQALVSRNEVSRDSLVWCEGMPEWKPVAQVSELNAGASTTGGFSQPAASASPYAAPASAPSVSPALNHPSMAAPTNGMAIASLICGILGLVACGFTCIPAVICGHLALSAIKKSPQPMGGRGMAIGGLITGYLVMVLCLFALVFFFFVSAETVKEAQSIESHAVETFHYEDFGESIEQPKDEKGVTPQFDHH